MKKKILLADDDPDQIFQLSHHLKKWGYDVVAVDPGKRPSVTCKMSVPIWLFST